MGGRDGFPLYSSGGDIGLSAISADCCGDAHGKQPFNESSRACQTLPPAGALARAEQRSCCRAAKRDQREGWTDFCWQKSSLEKTATFIRREVF